MSEDSTTSASINVAFGTVAAGSMVVAEAREGIFSAAKVQPTTAFSLHPFAHCLHYGSTCFEGL